MSAPVAPASTRTQIAVVLSVPVLVFLVGLIALPTPGSMRAAREGADREALKNVLVKRVPKDAETVNVTLDKSVRVLAAKTTPSGPIKPGTKLTLDSYYEVLGEMDRDWTMFLHIDRRGGSYRIHGDHEPADGRYATSLWREGEIVRDRFHKRVPVDAPAGTYDIWVGFYIKNTRMKFRSGDKSRHDGDNRIRLGTLKIQ